MNKHVKIAKDNVKSADLSRRSFLVGTAATGLALGYSAVPVCSAPTRRWLQRPISIPASGTRSDPTGSLP